LKKSLLYFLLLPGLVTEAQPLIHCDYKQSGIILVFPFQNSTIYTDTSALAYVLHHPQNTEQQKYFSRVERLLPSLCQKAVDDTIVLRNSIPFDDTLTDAYPTNWYVNLTIFQIIHSGKIRVTDENGRNVQAMRIRHLRKKRPDVTTTIYFDATSKKELFRETVNAEPLNLANDH
jgi:hypothetical protein